MDYLKEMEKSWSALQKNIMLRLDGEIERIPYETKERDVIVGADSKSVAPLTPCIDKKME